MGRAGGVGLSMSDNGQITWTNEKRLLSDLIPWPRNPRQVKVEQVKRL